MAKKKNTAEPSEGVKPNEVQQQSTQTEAERIADMMDKMNNPKYGLTAFEKPGGLRSKFSIEQPTFEDGTVPDGCANRSLNQEDGKVYKFSDYVKFEDNASTKNRFKLFSVLLLVGGVGSLLLSQRYFGEESNWPPVIAFAIVQGLTFLYAFLAYMDDDLAEEVESTASKKDEKSEPETKKDK